jgi:hypothetical protein
LLDDLGIGVVNLKGNCKRGNKCKYRHVGLDDYDRDKRHDQRNNKMYDPYDESDRLHPVF